MLKKVLNGIISISQSTFLGQRKMQDNILVLYENVDFAKRKKKMCLFLKVDFQKAYVCVSQGYLKFILQKWAWESNGSSG